MQANSLVLQKLAASDLVGFAQCAAIDADAFPYPSIPLGTPASLDTWVARKDEGRRVSGFLAATARPRSIYVHGLATDVTSRRLGIGRALVRACASGARARDFRSIVLHVSVVNRPALALYESEGFEVMRTMRDFYRPGVYSRGDAYEMVLSFDDLARRPA